MSLIEIMVFHLMVRTKDQSIMEYHDTNEAISGTLSAWH